ncbi:MAG: sigma-70 family RNA polymerase sigma factor [Pseudomonadota bacterium]
MYIESGIDTKHGARVENYHADEHLALLAKVAESGDKAAFHVLFQYYAPRIKSLMMKQGSGAEAAEDLMQETMLTVWQKSAQFSKWRGSVSAWIFTIARNKRIDRFRKQGTGHYVDVNELEIKDDTPGNDVQVEHLERDRIVRDATSQLPTEQKQVIELAYISELSQTQISKQLGIPLGTVKSRTRLAFETIRRKLEDLL